MSPIMLSLELLLATLLLAALWMGFRLEARLRALRESQSGFVKAVGDLDGAAQRTEAGLGALRDATHAADGALRSRVEAAELLVLRLDRLTGEAELAARRAEDAAESVRASARKLATVVPGGPRAMNVQSSGTQPSHIEHQSPEPARAETAPVSATPKLRAPDFAAMLGATRTTRQPLPSTPELQPVAGASRLREAAALLRGGR